MPKGEKNKLTKEQREEIQSLKGQESAYKLAEQFGVTHTAIYNLWKKKDRNQMETIDTKILKKLIPLFIQVANKEFDGLQFPELNAEEQERIGGLFNE